MNRPRLVSSWIGLLVLALGGVSLMAAERTNATSGTDYASFRIITERNIFNANRSGRSRSPRETRRPARVDAVALVGTMSYEKGRFAFFDGSSSEYRKALKVEGTIADFKVLDIGAKSVKLEVKGQPVELPVGSQLRREDGGEWKVAAHSDLPASSGGRTDEARPPDRGEDATRSGTESAASSSGMSEALKRLLEQRERETK